MKGRLRFLPVILLSIVAVGGVGAGGFFYSRYKQASVSEEMKAEVAIEEMVAAIKAHILVPDELPTLAEVTDPAELASVPFFKLALQGDKLLVFPTSGLAVLYRPEVDRIVNVAVIDSGAETVADGSGSAAVADGATTTETAIPLTPPKIAFYNGTSVVGLAKQTAEQLQQSFGSFEQAGLVSAVKRDYVQTVVTDFSGTRGAEAQKIAELLGGVVGIWPEGEAIPSAEIGVMVGQ